MVQISKERLKMNNLSHQEQRGVYPHRARHVKYMKNKALIPEELFCKNQQLLNNPNTCCGCHGFTSRPKDPACTRAKRALLWTSMTWGIVPSISLTAVAWHRASHVARSVCRSLSHSHPHHHPERHRLEFLFSINLVPREPECLHGWLLI